MKHQFNTPDHCIINVEVTLTCRRCECRKAIVTTANDIFAWRDGCSAQEVFSYLTVADREFLISKICGDCFEELFVKD